MNEKYEQVNSSDALRIEESFNAEGTDKEEVYSASTEAKAKEQEALESQIAEFLAKGGKIEVIDSGGVN